MDSMRKFYLLSGLLIPFVLLWSVQAQPPGKSNPPAVNPAEAIRASSPVGISSCSGGGCHGSAIPENTPALAVPARDAWRSAYTHWLSYDNHAKAFNVLREERAQRMMIALSGQAKTLVDQSGQETDGSGKDESGKPEITKAVTTFPVRVKDADGIIEERRATFTSANEKDWKVVPKKGEDISKLKILSPARYHLDATQESRCLACHVNPALAFTPSDGTARNNIESHRRQGVGCEACHGNASSWRDSHVKWADGPSKKSLYEESGMIWLNDPVSRARACAGCHVGAPPDAQSPEVRNMNHDMIAAGHPRLNFEYNTYQLMETPHWIEKNRSESDPQKKKVTLDATFHGRNWLVGRAVQLESSIALLEYRTRPEAPQATDFVSLEKEAEATLNAKTAHRVDPWPELSEFNCYSCHQTLRAEFYPSVSPSKFPFAKKIPQQDLVGLKLAENLLPPRREPGAWVWDPLFSTGRVFNVQQLEETAISSLIALQGAVNQRKSKPSEINALAKKALRDWKIVSNSFNVNSSLDLEKRRATLKDLPEKVRWDDLAQTYLGIRSLNSNQGNREIEAKLSFPYVAENDRQDGPRGYGLVEGDGKTPVSFDPVSARAEFLKDLSK